MCATRSIDGRSIHLSTLTGILRLPIIEGEDEREDTVTIAAASSSAQRTVCGLASEHFVFPPSDRERSANSMPYRAFNGFEADAHRLM